MSRYDEIEQDHPLDESTSAKVQHFNSEGYVLPDEAAASPTEIPDVPGSLTGPAAASETDEPDADDGLFHDQQMPTADGELSDPDPDEGLADEETERTTP
ncbi:MULTISPECIES: hypothetical protein [unclassified Salinibacterium]|uniref:hypothetical protein n=1 Tax=unclassified Salinibacterium TaxID=2632331 RepID=UPI001421C8E6|nr:MULTISPECIES: hypothetical protein [unclassified Salinibacterium]